MQTYTLVVRYKSDWTHTRTDLTADQILRELADRMSDEAVANDSNVESWTIVPEEARS